MIYLMRRCVTQDIFPTSNIYVIWKQNVVKLVGRKKDTFCVTIAVIIPGQRQWNAFISRVHGAGTMRGGTLSRALCHDKTPDVEGIISLPNAYLLLIYGGRRMYKTQVGHPAGYANTGIFAVCMFVPARQPRWPDIYLLHVYQQVTLSFPISRSS